MILFYIPCPDKASAENIGHTLLSEKLIACANIIPGMESIYRWEGVQEISSEYILLLKTIKSANAEEKITKRVEALHPYKVPCVMILSILGINESYKKWLEESLK